MITLTVVFVVITGRKKSKFRFHPHSHTTDYCYTWCSVARHCIENENIECKINVMHCSNIHSAFQAHLTTTGNFMAIFQCLFDTYNASIPYGVDGFHFCQRIYCVVYGQRSPNLNLHVFVYYAKHIMPPCEKSMKEHKPIQDCSRLKKRHLSCRNKTPFTYLISCYRYKHRHRNIPCGYCIIYVHLCGKSFY